MSGETHHTMTLFQCAPDFAWPIIVINSLIVVAYIDLTARRFLPAARRAKTRSGQWVWYSISFVFPFCGISGYATTILSGWSPELAYMLKVKFGVLDLVAVLGFIWFTRGLDLATSDPAERLSRARSIAEDEALDPEQAIRLLRDSLHKERG